MNECERLREALAEARRERDEARAIMAKGPHDAASATTILGLIHDLRLAKNKAEAAESRAAEAYRRGWRQAIEAAADMAHGWYGGDMLALARHIRAHPLGAAETGRAAEPKEGA